MSNYQTPYQLIKEACKVAPNDELIRSYINKIDNWRQLFDSAYMHGVFPLVYDTLKKHRDMLSSDVLDTFKLRNLEIAQSNMLMTSELLRIVKLFDQFNIPYITLKGPVLSQIIHGDTIHRQFTDLDILVSRDNMQKVSQILLDHGYKTLHPIAFLSNKALLNIGKDFTFQHIESKTLVEMHWSLFLNAQIEKSKINLFSDNNIVVNIKKTSVKTLALEHLLIYLCLHGSKHLWERISWIVDIDRLIRAHDDINWEYIQTMIKQMQIENMFYLGLSLSRAYFKTDVPSEVVFKINTIKTVGKVQQVVDRFIHSNNIATTGNKANAIAILHNLAILSDTKLMMVRHYFLTLFQIKNKDIYIINLPSYFHPFYYVVRLYRFIAEAIVPRKKQ